MTKKEIYFELDDMNEICESNIFFMTEKLRNNEIFDYCPVPEIRIEIVRLTQERCVKEAEYKKSFKFSWKKNWNFPNSKIPLETKENIGTFI